MVVKYDLKSDSNFFKRFDRLCKIRDKWCTALNKDFFSVGILSSQRSESTKMQLVSKRKGALPSPSFTKFSRWQIARWSKTELDAEFYCSRTKHRSTFKLFGLLKHAAEVTLSFQRFWRGIYNGDFVYIVFLEKKQFLNCTRYLTLKHQVK